jgi:hypothetical protein
VGSTLAPAESAGLRLPPELLPHLVCAYDFEHPAPADPALELDQGPSGTPLRLVNGGAAMRVPDGAHAGSRHSLQTRQIHPELAGQDDWKAGAFGRPPTPPRPRRMIVFPASAFSASCTAGPTATRCAP